MRDMLGADEWISAEVNASEIDRSKPAPDIFELALERSGASTSSALVIGDTGWDVDAATRCGLPCIAVTTGGWSRLDLEARGALEVYDDLRELTACMDSGLVGRLTR
jgi:phosphoglycolate phosphatase-like HAD superfamily hydrolase